MIERLSESMPTQKLVGKDTIHDPFLCYLTVRFSKVSRFSFYFNRIH